MAINAKIGTILSAALLVLLAGCDPDDSRDSEKSESHMAASHNIGTEHATAAKAWLMLHGYLAQQSLTEGNEAALAMQLTAADSGEADARCLLQGTIEASNIRFSADGDVYSAVSIRFSEKGSAENIDASVYPLGDLVIVIAGLAEVISGDQQDILEQDISGCRLTRDDNSVSIGTGSSTVTGGSAIQP